MQHGAGFRVIGWPSRRPLPTVAAAVLAVTMAGAGSSSTADPGPGGSARARFLMGTRLTIECRGDVNPRLFDEAFEAVARLEGILSNWIESSEVSRLNREGLRAPFRVSGDLLHAIEVSLAWAERTGGAFDPTVESLVRRYGLRAVDSFAGFRSEPDGERGEAAGEGSVSEPRPVVGWRDVDVDREGHSVRFRRDGIGIDLGGIGKGIALDEAVRILRAGGVAGGLLDFGGQVIAVGEAAPEDGWLIGVADPERRDRAVATVTLRRGSLATSGNSERAVTLTQGSVGHILDPASGAPARFAGSVSVLAEDGTSADALSTALFVMGPERGLGWAESRGIAALYIRRTDDGELQFMSTRALRPGIDWAPVEPTVRTGS